ncbi:UNVERIFIED_CONTAM: hypothetical protein NCL1_50422 [Trichonephila clavipes]
MVCREEDLYKSTIAFNPRCSRRRQIDEDDINIPVAVNQRAANCLEKAVIHRHAEQPSDQGIGSGWLAPSSSPVPLKTRRVGKRCKLNLSRAQASSLWCSVVGRREGVPAQVSSSSLDHGWFKMMRSVAKNLRVAEQCDVNNNSSSRWRGMATWRGDTSSDVVLVT